MQIASVNKMILDNLKKDQINARKNKDAIKATLLTTLISEIEMIGKNEKRDVNDNDSIRIINKFKKGVQENIDVVLKSTSKPILLSKVEQLKNEERVYSSYLPSVLTDDELKTIIKENIDNGFNMKDIMSLLKNKYTGRYDGKKASNLIKELQA